MSETPPDNLDTPNARRSGPLTQEQRAKKQARFIARYRTSGNIKTSCKYAGISRATFYEWKANDPAFQAMVADAEPDVDDTLEQAAHDRGVEGVPSYVVSQGHMVYEEVPAFNTDGTPKLNKDGKQVMLRGKPLVERKYSDALLVTLLKARMPEKYKERAAWEHTGRDGGPIDARTTLALDLSKLREATPEQLAALKALALELKAKERE